MSKLVLELENINKSFPGVKALKDVSFNLFKNEVHALLGANGAGKSTLIKIISGVYKCDSGTIKLDGREVVIHSPEEAQKFGVATVYQDFELAEQLTVAENLFMGRLNQSDNKFIDWDIIEQKARELLNKLNINIDPNIKTRNLGTGKQQMIEIIKAFSRDAQIIILDEPTSSLTKEETEELFDLIRSIRNQGIGVIYISHRLEEIKVISDRVSILRNGNKVGTFNTNEISDDKIVTLMLGKRTNNIFSKKESQNFDEELFKAQSITTEFLPRPISFSIKKGEVLGIAGILGSGRTELARAIFGIDSLKKGKLYLNNKKLNINTPQDAIKNRISLVPEDRHREGIFENLSVGENIVLNILKDIKGKMLLNKNQEIKRVKENMDRFNVKASGPLQIARSLSGGNQQKVVFARWLATQPSLLILDEPTRGIDVGAKREIYNLIRELSAKGISILMISSELNELIINCNRILVIRKKQICKEVFPSEVNEEQLVTLAMKGNN